MKTIKLIQFRSEPMINSNNEPYLQIIGLGEDGGIYSYGPNGQWVAISMEIYTPPPVAGLIEVVN